MKQFLLLFFCITTIGLIGQKTSFNKTKLKGIKKAGTVDVSTLDDTYIGHLEYVEAPSISGNAFKMHLANIKEDIAVLHPKQESPLSQTRSAVNPPDILEGYEVKGINLGSPIDNHLAMFDTYIVSAGNFYMSITNSAGGTFKTFSLSAFAGAAGISSQAFDPRLVFDPVNERFVLTFLAGFDSQNTDIVMAFSETNDPRGKWNIYSIEGNPNGLDEWTDYPMLAMTNDHLFLTINLLKDGETWQEGFIETIIWQIKKSSGYDDLDLDVTKWDEILYGNASIRNLCPAESAVDYYDDMVFISDRNFSIENDTFFMLRLDPNAAVGSEITVTPVLSDTPYGAPPNAVQPVGELQTNDARVLEAFRHNDEIQFVGNTRNLENNKAGIFHGIIEDINDPQGVVLNHIIGSDYELGYPGITYTGDGFFERDAIINFNHASASRNPGTSALYSIPDEGYSVIVETGKGLNHVDMFPGAPIERWGDYSGSQRDFDNPEEVWVAGYIGNLSRANAPFIRRLRRPQIQTGIGKVEQIATEIKAFPNPSIDRVTVEVDIPHTAQHVIAYLHDTQGKSIAKLYESNHAKKGINKFSFNTETLAPGSYFVKLTLDNKTTITKQVVVQ